MKAILRKELADYFTSIRVLVLFALALLATAAALYADYQGIRGAGAEGFVFLRLFTTSGEVTPSLADLFALFFIPLIGIALGFDAVNSERTGGTLSAILSQPLYRDSVINGKFLAAVVTLVIMVGTSMLLTAGYGLRMIGVPPNAEEIVRLSLYLGLSTVYGAFWIGLAILFSVVFRRIAASLLFSIAVWLFFSVFILIIAPAVANAIAPMVEGNQASILRNVEINQMLLRVSPNILFTEAAQALLHPVILETSMGLIGAISSGQAQYMLASPLSLGQSLLIIWPHLTGLISLSVVCFAVSYILFMRQEIRAT
ncbi:MAG: ABC transporter permease [Chloroflexi bacterium]|nr:ABC transporter permease [Chloroflexota bacterium]